MAGLAVALPDFPQLGRFVQVLVCGGFDEQRRVAEAGFGDEREGDDGFLEWREGRGSGEGGVLAGGRGAVEGFGKD